MPINITSGYTPTTAYTNVSGGNGSPTEYLQALLNHEVRQRRYGGAATARRPTSVSGARTSRAQQTGAPTERARPGVETMQQQAKLAELSAAINPPPMRHSFILGSTGPVLTPDISRMNSFQRERYLPGNTSGAPLAGLQFEALRGFGGSGHSWDPLGHGRGADDPRRMR